MSQIFRCAIYAPKSTEEGLDQQFNSLDAQREACEAYIASQRHEGWKALPKHYDDGGYSGGNTQRPALQSLLTDIATGKVDLIVVYKMDRLTRSLMDFAKMHAEKSAQKRQNSPVPEKNPRPEPRPIPPESGGFGLRFESWWTAWWAHQDSNLEPRDYESPALTN